MTTTPLDPATADDIKARVSATADDVRDEHGLTRIERDRWRAHYHAISMLTGDAVSSAPTPGEARRRLALLKLELRAAEATVDQLAAQWTR